MPPKPKRKKHWYIIVAIVVIHGTVQTLGVPFMDDDRIFMFLNMSYTTEPPIRGQIFARSFFCIIVQTVAPRECELSAVSCSPETMGIGNGLRHGNANVEVII